MSEQDSKVRIMVIDDHLMFVEGLVTLLERNPNYDIVATASSAEELIDKLRSIQADVLLLDVNMGGMSGIEAGRIIKKKYPETAIILLTMFDDIRHIKKGIDSGISGYLLKDTDKQELERAIAAVTSGKSYFSQRVSDVYMEDARKPEAQRSYKEVSLTAREVQVLTILAEGLTTRAAAEKLNLSTHTIESYRKSLLVKLQAKNTVSLIKHAYQLGLLK